MGTKKVNVIFTYIPCNHKTRGTIVITNSPENSVENIERTEKKEDCPICNGSLCTIDSYFSFSYTTDTKIFEKENGNGRREN